MLNLWQTSLFLTSVFCVLDMQVVWAKSPVPAKEDTETTLASVQIEDERPSIRRVRDLEKVSTRVADLFAQQPTTTRVIQITGVKATPTNKGVEVILETTVGAQLQVINRSTSNNFIADIPNAQLRLPNGDGFTFRSEKPLSEIAEITVTNVDANTVRVTVVGEKALPTVELFDDNAGLVFGINSAATAMQPPPEKPTTETPQEEPAAQQDEPIELVVTGEQDGYRVPNSSTGTRTDTPLRDIPQSIQVVPQQVLRDQQVNRLDDALRNVAGVTAEFTAGPTVYYKIRGFAVADNSLLRDGLPDPGVGDSVELANVERIEVLKGPASVLFGLGSPGGSINIVTKRPLSEPFYAVDATIGSYSFYRGAVDFSGPLNDSKTALYRFNAVYRNSGSFIDFYNSESLSLSPVVSLAIGKKTNLTLSADYIGTRDSGKSFGLPTVGTIFANPNGKLPRNRNLTEPTDNVDGTTVRAGYQLEHKFNDNWSLTNAFRYGYRSLYSIETRLDGLDADNRTINRSLSIYDNRFTSYNLTTNVVGKFSTGSIGHQLLFGVDLNRSISAVPRTAGDGDAASIDIFNPVYGQPNGGSGLFPFEASNEATTDSFGIYLQDQVALTESLKVLLGARFDGFKQVSEDFIANTESSQSDSALSPRIGIVYQPIPAISLYASYISSFTPARGTFLFGSNLDTLFEPERGRQFEVGVKADLNSRLSATLALYDLTRTNVLVTDPNDDDFQIQTGEQNSRGIELSLSGEILPGWNIIAGYAYTDARITKDTTFEVGSRLQNAADHAFNVWTTYEIQKGDLQGLGFGLGLFFVGDRAGDLPNTYDIPSYLRTDASIFYNRDRFRIGLNFKNLFDVEYFELGYFGGRVDYGQPFTVQGTVSFQF
ncbi:TonB-dependent receptor [Nostoc sp. CHAB 5714]|uniref:TonB-dependent receptor n=2 Tax=Nostoc TaxID=1177 RepID=A0ABS8IB48_9NOSO|nr:TonB-dependent receptor [Nostoc favosum]MCC5601445.1 TonB-dependent receptor [Nostoc favosum CHAB5714]